MLLVQRVKREEKECGEEQTVRGLHTSEQRTGVRPCHARAGLGGP